MRVLNKRSARRSSKIHRAARFSMALEPIESRIFLSGTPITTWNFDSDPTGLTTPTPNIGTGTATSIGMALFTGPDASAVFDATGANGGSSDGASTYAWKVVGTNGWNSGAGIGTQGAQFNVDTTGYTDINVSFDVYATTQGEGKITLQYTTDGSTWNNVSSSVMGLGSASATNTAISSNSSDANTVDGGYFTLSGAQAWHNQMTVNLSGISAAANDPKFAIRLVNAATGADCVNLAGSPINNTSGNWRFDEVKINGTAATPVAPTITQNPTSQSVPSGSTATFTAAASGYPAPSVQWEVSTNDGMTFNDVTTGTGGTTDSYTTPTLTTAYNNYQYEAVFSNGVLPNATTTAATLTVETTPVVLTQPLTQAVNAGSSVTLTSTASGATSQQWEVSTNGGAFAPVVPADTTTSLTLSPTEEQTGNQYELVFTNSLGSTPSNAATITVVGTPITQWIFNTPAQSGPNGSGTANTPAPTLANDPNTDSSTDLGFSNDYDGVQSFPEADILATTGTADSSFSTLTWRIRGGGGGGPTGSAGSPDGWSQYAPEGSVYPQYAQGAQFNVDTTGYSNVTLQFQWYSTGSAILDMQEQYTPDGGSTWIDLGSPIQGVSGDYSGYNGSGYTPVLMNLQGITAANNNPNFGVRLISAYDANLPLIYDQNALINGGNGFHGQYASAGTGTVNATQLLTFGGSNLGGTFTLNFDGQTTAPIAYDSNSTNLAFSIDAALAALSNIGGDGTDLSGPLATDTNVSVAPALSGNAFTITFVGSMAQTPEPTITVDSTGLTGTNPSLTAATTVVGGSTGIIPYVDGGGNWRLGDITFNGDGLNGGLGVSQEPQPTSVIGSTNATFTAVAYSELAPVTVQWQVSENGGPFNDIGGFTSSTTGDSTTSTLTVPTNVGLTQNGYEYRAEFSNVDGSVTSQPALLTVVAPAAPADTGDPASVSVLDGGIVNFTASATGSPTPTVQWQVDTGSGFTNVTTGTTTNTTSGDSISSVYSFTAADGESGYEYRAVFTNAVTSLDSAAASLSVLEPETIITQWDFSTHPTSGAGAFDNSPTPTTEVQTGVATVLGMDQTNDNGENSPSVAAADVTNTAGTANPNFSENLWRIRGGPTATTGGAPGNGWNSVAPEYSQGAQWAVDTTGYQNIYATVDWYSTTQGIRDLQVQYTTDGSTWVNLGSPLIATANDYYGASPGGTTIPVVVDLTNVPAANNNPNLAIRLVAAYDPGLPLITDPPGTIFVDGAPPLPEPHGQYAAASSTAGDIIPYNDSSGNWRFGDITFEAIPTWLAPGSQAIFNGVTHALPVTGAATIVADPGTDSPLVTANSVAAQLGILPAVQDQTINVSGLSLSSGAGASIASTTTLAVTGSVQIDSNSKLDITTGRLVINYGLAGNSSPFSTIEADVAEAYHGGAWTGNGITSSAAATNGNYGIGVVDGSVDQNTVAGQGQVVAQYALLGDTNLDGTVNLTDLLSMLNNYGLSGRDWADGDTNYDGTVNLTDLLALLNNYGESGGSVTAASALLPSQTPARAAAPPVNPNLALSSNQASSQNDADAQILGANAPVLAGDPPLLG